VINKANGKSVVVRINDRGPFHGRRVLDVSLAAAQQIGMYRAGKATVRMELLR
jgi:rare lipoprotein A